MASSTTHLHGGATSAPPPTPSAQSGRDSTSDAAEEVLSRLLHRLPPALSSLPARRASPSACSPPTISFPELEKFLQLPEIGFFQLTDHPVPSQLAHSAESNSVSLFKLTSEQKQLLFPPNWPLGFDKDEDEGDESFCFESSKLTTLSSSPDGSTQLDSSELTQLNMAELLDMSSLGEFICEMEKLGLELVEWLSRVTGFENPGRLCSLMWVSESGPGRTYPYIVGLQYQLRNQMHSVQGDSGWVTVLPKVDSIFVTLGDVAQVWSNGKLKKVRGRPAPVSGDHGCITMSLLVTLPMDSIVSPRIPPAAAVRDGMEKGKEAHDDVDATKIDRQKMFESFPFEDYAWRVYHERCSLSKDPLERYRA